MLFNYRHLLIWISILVNLASSAETLRHDFYADPGQMQIFNDESGNGLDGTNGSTQLNDADDMLCVKDRGIYG